MCLMVVRDHDRVRYCLGNNISHPVLERKNDPVNKTMLATNNP